MLHAQQGGITQHLRGVGVVVVVVDFHQGLDVVRHDAFQIVECLVPLQVVRGLVQTALHAFVELVLAHLHHHAGILTLQKQQNHEADTDADADD